MRSPPRRCATRTIGATIAPITGAASSSTRHPAPRRSVHSAHVSRSHATAAPSIRTDSRIHSSARGRASIASSRRSTTSGSRCGSSSPATAWPTWRSTRPSRVMPSVHRSAARACSSVMYPVRTISSPMRRIASDPCESVTPNCTPSVSNRRIAMRLRSSGSSMPCRASATSWSSASVERIRPAESVSWMPR